MSASSMLVGEGAESGAEHQRDFRLTVAFSSE